MASANLAGSPTSLMASANPTVAIFSDPMASPAAPAAAGIKPSTPDELAYRLDDGADHGNDVGRQSDRGGEGFAFGDATECAACTTAAADTGELRAGLCEGRLVELDADLGGVAAVLDLLDFLLRRRGVGVDLDLGVFKLGRRSPSQRRAAALTSLSDFSNSFFRPSLIFSVHGSRVTNTSATLATTHLRSNRVVLLYFSCLSWPGDSES